MIICIDSQVIVWGIKKQATKGQEDMISKAETFFNWVDNNEYDIIIPAIVVAEVLAPEPETIRANYLKTLTTGFVIVPFDTRAAFKYADILHGRFNELKAAADQIDISKHRMKADHMIIATAIVNNANCIYSYDKGLTTFGSGFIDVRKFPEPPRDLFNQK